MKPLQSHPTKSPALDRAPAEPGGRPWARPGIPAGSRRLPVVLLVVLAAAWLGACTSPRGLEAWRLLDDLAAGAGPSALKAATPEPRRIAVSYRVEERSHAGDLYRPGEPARAALVLVPGAAPQGKDDPRLVAVARSLARARFLVLVPEIANLRALKLRPEDAGAVADALRHLSARTGGSGGAGAGAPEGSVGLVAISYATGPAVLAALEPDLRARVRFLVAVGGYYDIEALVTFFTTGHYRPAPDLPWEKAEPNPYGKWIFLRSNAQRVEAARDRVLLLAMAQRKLDDLGAGLDDLTARLGPEGRAVHALLVNRDPGAVPGLIAALPPGVRRDLAALDLKRRDLGSLAAEAILIHGRNDAVIPYSESKALAAALAPERARLTLVDNLAHVELGPAGVGDSLRLWRTAYRVLSLRDLGPAPAGP